MAKDRSASEERRHQEKKEKKKLKKLAEENGVQKPSDKEQKKVKKMKEVDVVEDADGDLVLREKAAEVVEGDENGEIVKHKIRREPLIGALVPFARPLADDKEQKKILKAVKKASKQQCIKRGVKEVVKALRKSPQASAVYSTLNISNPKAITKSPQTEPSDPKRPQFIVIIAGDISPIDVISHLPVLCEDHAVPYIFVPSRAELGNAGSTKRPTSVVMLTPESSTKKAKAVKAEKAAEGKKDEVEEEQKDWEETYMEIAKLIGKAS